MTLKGTREETGKMQPRSQHHARDARARPTPRYLIAGERDGAGFALQVVNRSNKYSDQLVCICPAKLVAKRH